MTQVGSLGTLVFVCLHRDIALLGSLPQEYQLVLSTDGLCLCDISSPKQLVKLRERVNKSSRFTLRRYLDRFYLLVSDDAVEKRQEILDKFFNLIGDEYESLIDVPRNVENIRNLLGFVSQFAGYMRGATILDYGCGTGLSLGPTSDFNINLVGVDRCPIMCRIARNRGMTVWSFEELAQKSFDQISGAFASYVFHLLPQTDGLCLLWAHLRKGGIFVANFHKNQGIETVNNCVSDLGGDVKLLKSPLGSERHGAYIAYIKS